MILIRSGHYSSFIIALCFAVTSHFIQPSASAQDTKVHQVRHLITRGLTLEPQGRRLLTPAHPSNTGAIPQQNAHANAMDGLFDQNASSAATDNDDDDEKKQEEGEKLEQEDKRFLQLYKELPYELGLFIETFLKGTSTTCVQRLFNKTDLSTINNTIQPLDSMSHYASEFDPRCKILAVSPDGTRRIIQSIDDFERLHIWDVQKQKTIQTLHIPHKDELEGPFLTSISPDNRTVTTSCSEWDAGKKLHTWNAETGETLYTLGYWNTLGARHQYLHTTNNKHIVTKENNSIHIYDRLTGKRVDSVALTANSTIYNLRISADSRYLILSDRDSGAVRLWDLWLKKRIHNFTFPIENGAPCPVTSSVMIDNDTIFFHAHNRPNALQCDPCIYTTHMPNALPPITAYVHGHMQKALETAQDICNQAQRSNVSADTMRKIYYHIAQLKLAESQPDISDFIETTVTTIQNLYAQEIARLSQEEDIKEAAAQEFHLPSDKDSNKE